ncbi:SEC-C domain-containing protein [Providencia stuartii]|nr:SEC-C domain-containing protein [Providencia stuartii]
MNITKVTPTRNQQCPCGSGVRYKWCCGKLK